MSDFDKEAEREKLRERFERDEEKRKHTQKMSELLLKGATMTNRHCTDCGDPIFRQNGREFCPTCGGEASTQGGQATEGAQSADASAEATEESAGATEESAGATEESAGAAGGSAAGRPNRESQTPTAESERDANRTTANVPNRVTTDREPATPAPPAPADEAAGSKTGRTAAASAGDDLAAARDSLARTVRRFARAAETTDDPRRAREHLEAAREAAAALAALE